MCTCLHKIIFSKESRNQLYWFLLIHTFNKNYPRCLEHIARGRVMMHTCMDYLFQSYDVYKADVFFPHSLFAYSWWGTHAPVGAGSALWRRAVSPHLWTQTSPSIQPRRSLTGGWTTWFSPQSTEMVMDSFLSVSTKFFPGAASVLAMKLWFSQGKTEPLSKPEAKLM